MNDGDEDAGHKDYKYQGFAPGPPKGVVISVIATISINLWRLPL